MTSVSHLLNSASPNPAQMQDLQYKLQQVHNQAQQQRQLDMLSKMMNARQQQQPTISPVPDMGIAQARELLNRPEAQAILQGELRYVFCPLLCRNAVLWVPHGVEQGPILFLTFLCRYSCFTLRENDFGVPQGSEYCFLAVVYLLLCRRAILGCHRDWNNGRYCS